MKLYKVFLILLTIPFTRSVQHQTSVQFYLFQFHSESGWLANGKFCSSNSKSTQNEEAIKRFPQNQQSDPTHSSKPTSPFKDQGTANCQFGFFLQILNESLQAIKIVGKISFQIPGNLSPKGGTVTFKSPLTYGDWLNPTSISIDPLQTGYRLYFSITVTNYVPSSSQGPQYVDTFLKLVDLTHEGVLQETIGGILQQGNHLTLAISVGESPSTLDPSEPTTAASPKDEDKRLARIRLIILVSLISLCVLESLLILALIGCWCTSKPDHRSQKQTIKQPIDFIAKRSINSNQLPIIQVTEESLVGSVNADYHNRGQPRVETTASDTLSTTSAFSYRRMQPNRRKEIIHANTNDNFLTPEQYDCLPRVQIAKTEF